MSDNLAHKRSIPDLVDYGRGILSIESQAIANLSELLDENFAHAVDVILSMSKEGRVIVSGMGKAGFVAMKISATLASTGTPSFYLHPAEAIHGDLGRYSKQDVALVLSNSGETEELLRILPYIRRVGCPIISITATSQSTLSIHSDINLQIGKLTEAGPLNLAPTTTTVAMLALGDALSMTILSQRNFSKEDYAFYHPGGSLGRSLLLVSEIMRKEDEHCVVSQEMACKDVLHRMASSKRRLGAASVVDSDGTLVGIFTDGDLRRNLDHGIDFLERPVANVMTKSPKVVKPQDLAEDALRVLSEHKIDEVIVIDHHHKPIGLIDIQDLVGLKSRV